MKGLKIAIEKSTIENTNFRKVVYTSLHSQLVLMCLQPKEEIGEEIHHQNDQFFRFESGCGSCFIDGNEYAVGAGDAVVIPAGAKHNIINTDGEKELKMYTIYSPAQHQDGIVRKTKAEAEAKENKEEFVEKTTE